MCNHFNAAYTNLGMWGGGMTIRSMKDCSGGIESYLASLCPDLFQKLRSELEVTPCFQEPEGDIFCRSHTSWESFPKETASLDELKKGIGDLQEKVEDLAGCFIVAVGMLQSESPVLLDIEALVFNLPSDSTSIIGYFDHIPGSDLEVGHPLESGGFQLPIFVRFGLLALENGQRVLSFLRVDIYDVVYPAIFLRDLSSSTRTPLQVILRLELLESLELLLNGGKVIFQNNQVLPVVSVTQIEDGSYGKEAIKAQADGEARKSFLELFRQPVESLYLAVLLGGVLTGILYKLGHQREHEPLRCHQLCLEYLVVIDGFASMSLSEAVGAVPLLEGQGSGAIDIHNIVASQKPGRIEQLLSNKDLGHTRHGFLPLYRIEHGVEIIESISMGKGLHIEEHLEFLPGWLIVSELVSDLSPCSQPEQEHKNPRKAKRGKAVGDLVRHPGIGYVSKDLLEAAEKMFTRLDENLEQDLLILLVFINDGLPGQGRGCETLFHYDLLGSTRFQVEREKSGGLHRREALSSPYFNPIRCAKKDHSSLLWHQRKP